MSVHPTARIEMPQLIVTNAERIDIGEGVMIRAFSRLEAHTRVGDKLYDGRIIIGDGCQIEHHVCLAAIQPMVIGPRVLMASRVTILDHDHESDDPTMAILSQGVRYRLPICIGEGTWLCQNATVLASVGRNCIVGANTVVTKPIPDYCVVVGQPARIVKRYNPFMQLWERVS